MNELKVELDQLRLVFALARTAAPDADTLAVVDKVAKNTMTFLGQLHKAIQESESKAEIQQIQEGATPHVNGATPPEKFLKRKR